VTPLASIPPGPEIMKHIAFAATLLLGGVTALHGEEGPTLAPKPNVLLIMADDLRDFGGAFTKDVVKTPHLDRLRARGTTFERAYVQYPVCNPSRSSMMSGLRAEQTGIVGNDIPLRQKMPDVITLPQLCKEAGWQSHALESSTTSAEAGMLRPDGAGWTRVAPGTRRRRLKRRRQVASCWVAAM
jgi:arylsulfatase A-like enzyme